MTSIKIEFPADRLDIAAAFALALATVAGTAPEVIAAVPFSPAVSAAGPELEDTAPAPTNTAAAFAPPAKAEVKPGMFDEVVKRDLKGVAFNESYCATARDPYYASGSRSGQWKKRKGVDDKDYDTWYAAQPRTAGAEAKPEYPEDDEEGDAHVVNAAAAFGGAAAGPAPITTAPDLMLWTSERQAAQRLTAAQVDSVWKGLGLAVTDVFPPTPAATVEANVRKVHAALSALCGG